MTKSLLIPLNNVAGQGDFCAEIDVGNPPQRQHMLLDSGSSTFALSVTHYAGEHDEHLEPTTHCQHVKYGIGEWVGPVVSTSAVIGHCVHHIHVENLSVAIAETQVEGTFAKCNGILGLAYESLNTAHDLDDHTFPWNPTWAEKAEAPDFIKTLLAQPKVHVTPFFDACVNQKVIPNQFAFLVHRSSVFHGEEPLSEQAKIDHPLNRGLLAMGKPHLHTHLHHGDFVRLPLVCDKYYNVNLLRVQVGDKAPITPPPFTPKAGKARMNSNSFIDSGASMMVLPNELFKQVMADLAACVPEQANLLDAYQTFQGKEVGVPLDKLNLEPWPDIHFVFSGHDDSEEVLTLSAHSYWQTHAPESQQASFKLMTLPGWAAQTIIGLPLMCEYYTVFDRDTGELGEMAFANPRVAPHKLSDTIHNNIETLKNLCSHFLHKPSHPALKKD